MFNVTFAGVTAPLEDVQEHPATFLRRLEQAKIDPGHATCLCRGAAAPLRLQIRRYGSLLHLAGWPDEGPLHHLKCTFHKVSGAAGAIGGNALPGITAGATGLRVKLDVSLRQRGTSSVSKGPRAGSSGTVSRRAAPLLGFLQALWDVAGLNRWSGMELTRNWGVCNARILAGIGEAIINGEPADKVLHVMRRFQEIDREAINVEFDAFLARIGSTNGVNRRGIVVGEIAEIGSTQYGRSIMLRQSGKRYYSAATLIDYAEKKYAHAWRALGARHARVIAILVIERTAKGHLVVIDLAAMLYSTAYIACDSIHEVAVANRLIAEHRAFDKPLRLDEGATMLPDFILTDTLPATHVEVYGMNGNADYEARKAEKRAQRARQGIPSVEWNIDAEPLSAVQFPAPARAARAT